MDERRKQVRRHRQIAGALVASLLVALVAGLGCSAGIGRRCDVDSDCSRDQICAAGECTRTCTTDEDCERASYTCQPFTGSSRGESINACLSADAGVGRDVGTSCSTDRECREQFGQDAECGIDGRCVIAENHYGLVVRDTTEGVDPDNPGEDGGPGADIAAVFLVDSSGRPSGFAATVALERGNGAEGPASHITGQKPRLDASGECVDGGFDASTTSLGGRGGRLLVDFRGPRGESIEIERGQRVRVVEWGSENCGAAGADDEYEVALCVSETNTLDLERDCQAMPLVEQRSGFAEFVARPTVAGGDR